MKSLWRQKADDSLGHESTEGPSRFVDGRRPRAIQFPVHNDKYPRNRRIRRYLREQGWECTGVVRGKGRSSTLREKLASVLTLLANLRGQDVVILSEMSLKYAPFTWALSRVTGAVHVVDGFIGLYETDVEDKGLVPEHSVKARILKYQDNLAIRLADIYLVDTEVRAQKIRDKKCGNAVVLSLPVGAPPWAQHSSYESYSGSSSQVLYYGNYIPLHGLETYVEAIARIPLMQRPSTRMIGHGDCYPAIRNLVKERSLESVFTFEPPIPESALADAIEQSKVVLGIFGSSPKASTVIANKVWQGLASGRRVITRRSQALDEIAVISGRFLVQVEANKPEEMAEALLVALNEDDGALSSITEQLESYVNDKYEHFRDLLEGSLKKVSLSSPINRSDSL